MHFIKMLSRVTLIFSFVISCSHVPDSAKTRILFIGNSYTYYNSSPELLKSMVKEKFPNHEIEVKLVSQGGMTLKRHWEEGSALETLKSKDWDYVVLQEQSKLGMGLIIDNDIYFGDTDNFYEYARKFNTEIKKRGAQTVFFMTWSTKNKPNEQVILTHAYNQIASELDAILAPVGLVWDKLRVNNSLSLYDPDGSHPSEYGSFIVASTIFSTIFKESTEGLSNKISGFRLSSRGESSEEEEILLQLNQKNIEFIQKSSWNVVSKLAKKGGYLKLNEPTTTYSIPEIIIGDEINSEKIDGRWYGTSTYNNVYLGLILDITFQSTRMEAEISFFTPDRTDMLKVKKVVVEDDLLKVIISDSIRNMNSKIRFALKNGVLEGVSESFGGNIKNYKNWNLSKDNIKGGVDLEQLLNMISDFNVDIKNRNYIEASLRHYNKYSKLVGEEFKPSENYLNAQAYNYFQSGKNELGMDVLSLVLEFYPNSINAYNSYGEALNRFGKQKEAIDIFKKGIEIALKNEDSLLPVIQSNLDDLNENKALDEIPPPPPPPNR
ncbi:hypothetical protein [Urechidicola vernalis]|uniref:Tetratricopeptide repeat protein n=1 Tax=Urechidicola vernalis TaxID=3075600 RepID=A0ABU2Y6H7_9FLAO|nr:hypothetical protein [Urechidicola sp. P050]MDT0553805.1 hypothetical protein [Urechidicola sp. P050]